MTETSLVDISYFLLVFYASLLSAMIFVPWSKKIALQLGLLDHPNARKVHSEPLTRMGGLGIAAASFSCVFLSVNITPPVHAFLLAGGIIVFVGLLDDIYSLSPKIKFLGQIIGVTTFVLAGGGRVESLGNLLGLGGITLGPFAALFTVFGMVGIINAMNLSDGLDGLAGGMTAIALMFMAILAYAFQNWSALVLALVILGAVLGFLRHNSYPAKLFMGDTGSLFLGYSLSALAVLLSGSVAGGKAVPAVLPAVILSLPISDTIFVMGRRLCLKMNPFMPDRYHLHHRLMGLGLHHADVVAILYTLMLALGSFAWFGRQGDAWQIFYPVLFFYLFLYCMLGWGERQGVHLGRILLRRVFPSKSVRRRQLHRRLAKVSGGIIQVAFPLYVVMLFLPAFALCPPPRITGYFSVAALFFIGVIYPWQGGKREMGMAHGIFFVATFFVLLLYGFHPGKPLWFTAYVNTLSLVALGLAVPIFLYGRHGRILLPVGYEVMLIVIVWFVPLLLAPTLGLSMQAQGTVAWACAQAVPILIFFKFALRRHARRNRFVIVGFLAVFFLLGISSFLGSPSFN